LLVSCLAYPLTLKMEAVHTYEMSVVLYTRLHGVNPR
jgi:hypothetical protein